MKIIPKGHDVYYDKGFWRIVGNESEYELMPFYADQNSGLKITVPLDTEFEKIYGQGVIYQLVSRLTRK